MTASTDTIQTLVTFAAAPGPYHHQYRAEVAAEKVLTDALAFFEISTDGTTRYYLLFKGQEVPGTETLGELIHEEHHNDHEHGHQHEIKFALRTETISGGR